MNIKKYLLTIVTLAISTLSIAAHATVYHLVCRGGVAGNNEIHVIMYPDADGFAEAWIQYHFQPYPGPKSSVQTDGSELAPGQCSWSTGLLGKNQNYFVHIVDQTQINVSADFTPSIGSNNSQQTASPNIWITPDRNDPNQDYLPYFASNGSVAQGAGSIVDPDMIFHIYVSINSDGSFRFYKLSSVVKMY